MIGPIARRRRRRLGLLSRAVRVLLAVMVVGGAAGMYALAVSPDSGGAFVIRGPEGFEEIVTTGADGRFVVPGPVGETVVVVDGGVAFVESSDCRHQVCVNTGQISAPGELIACVPNGVTIIVTGERDGGPDAVTR